MSVRNLVDGESLADTGGGHRNETRSETVASPWVYRRGHNVFRNVDEARSGVLMIGLARRCPRYAQPCEVTGYTIAR